MSLQGLPSGVLWPEGWPPPNYENPPIRGTPALFIITSTFTGVVVALRLYSRFCLTKSPGIDDTFLVAAFIFSIGQTYASYKNLTTWGWNKHLWDVPLTDHEYIRLGAWLQALFFLLGMACVKISILLVYRRISSGSSNRWFIRLTWAAIFFTVTYVLALALYLFLICHPMDSYWKSYSPTYTKPFKCGDERVPILLTVVLNVVSDIYATVLPMFLVRKLRLSKKQRIGLIILFSVGILTVVTGAVRIYYLDIVTTNYKPGLHTHDVTWYGWPLYAWTDIEAHLAIICASAPALKVLFTEKLKSSLRQLATSRPGLPRAQSQASSSKPLVSWPSSRARRNKTSVSTWDSAPHDTIEIIHDPTKSQMQAHTRDLERFPLEQITYTEVDKPLPTRPRSSSFTMSTNPSLTAWRPTSRSQAGDDAHSGVSIDAMNYSKASSVGRADADPTLRSEWDEEEVYDYEKHEI